ncbi:hypothetical protein EDB87DRAFT_1619398 [Lactarius vividus]|nr:hypothetical protein EDB87DRAFT_1619398 [Lactarius vividus]
MAQVCGQFFPFLFRVDNLGINTSQSSSGQDDVDGEQWLELIRAFGGATDFRVADEHTAAILRALGLVDGVHVNVLPSMRHLHIENPMAMNDPSWDGLLSFITLRSRAGHPVQVNVPFNQCHICHASFREQKGLNRHLVDKHAYRILCLYCGDFECKPGNNDLFREHLENEHSDTEDALLWNPNPFLTPYQLDSLISRHSSLHTPETVAPSTVTAPHSQ